MYINSIFPILNIRLNKYFILLIITRIYRDIHICIILNDMFIILVYIRLFKIFYLNFNRLKNVRETIVDQRINEAKRL